jgi:hypothetical protein
MPAAKREDEAYNVFIAFASIAIDLRDEHQRVLKHFT